MSLSICRRKSVRSRLIQPNPLSFSNFSRDPPPCAELEIELLKLPRWRAVRYNSRDVIAATKRPCRASKRQSIVADAAVTKGTKTSCIISAEGCASSFYHCSHSVIREQPPPNHRCWPVSLV